MNPPVLWLLSRPCIRPSPLASPWLFPALPHPSATHPHTHTHTLCCCPLSAPNPPKARRETYQSKNAPLADDLRQHSLPSPSTPLPSSPDVFPGIYDFLKPKQIVGAYSTLETPQTPMRMAAGLAQGSVPPGRQVCQN